MQPFRSKASPLWAALLAGLAAACGGAAPSVDVARVAALRETPPVDAAGDAADDPAIWVAPEPELSLVIATQKQGGLHLYDLGATVLQSVPGGRPNNVDLRPGFPWSAGESPIVGASDRSDNALVFWRLDAAQRRLEPEPAARVATGFAEVYGFCLGRMGDDFVAVATDKNSGDIGVWRIAVDADGSLTGERIASFSLGSITEGCVIDDERGVFYLAEELRAIWEVALGDASGGSRRQLDAIGPNGHLAPDIEGLSLWRGADGGGYLVASVQGRSRFAVYDRAPPHAFRGSFAIAASADGAVDGVSGTDGIDIASAPLGADFPQGLVVVQDDENTDPQAAQNFKFVSWAAVAAALRLE